MEYKLAKELKDCGFPYRDGINSIHPRTFPIKNVDSIAQALAQSVPFPDLSELIEACGERFCCVHKRKDGWGAEDMVNSPIIRASTPEEAVARLWLALNRK